MSVEFKINISKDIDKALIGAGKKAPKAYSYDMLDDLTRSAVNNIVSGQDMLTTQKSLTAVFNDYEATAKDGLKATISTRAGVNWDDIATEQSFNGTYNQTINKSFIDTKRQLRKVVEKSQRRYNTMQTYLKNDKLGYLKKMGISGDTEKELILKMNKQIAEDIANALGATMKHKEDLTLITETQGIRYKKFKEEQNKKLELEPVQWITAEDERVCPICGARDNVIYRNVNEAPPYPAHPRCRCEYQNVSVDEYLKQESD